MPIEEPEKTIVKGCRLSRVRGGEFNAFHALYESVEQFNSHLSEGHVAGGGDGVQVGRKSARPEDCVIVNQRRDPPQLHFHKHSGEKSQIAREFY